MREYEIDPSQFPVTVGIPDGEGLVVNEKQPVYRLDEPGFYGDTFFDEGEVITSTMVPNITMIPLNRAAAERLKAWQESLPIKGGESLTIEDFSEAAMMLRNDPELTNLPPETIAQMTMKLAVTMRNKRTGSNMVLTGVGEMSRRAKNSAPPMPNIRVTDAARRGYGAVGEADVLHQPRRASGPVQRVRTGPGRPPSVQPPVPAST